MSDTTEGVLSSLPPILDLRDLMRVFRVSERTAYRLLKEPRLHAYQDADGGWNINREDIVEWLQDNA